MSVATNRETAHAADPDPEAVEVMIDAEGHPALDPTQGAHPAAAEETAKGATLPSGMGETTVIANGKGIE